MGGSLSDSKYACRNAGVRWIDGDAIALVVDTLECVRSIGELTDDGEPASDSGSAGS